MVVVIGVVVVAVIVIVGTVWAARQGREHRLDERRVEAGEHRDLARDRQLEADRLRAEADESAARATREAAVAEQQASAAERARTEAADIAQRARELDPDEHPDRAS